LCFTRLEAEAQTQASTKMDRGSSFFFSRGVRNHGNVRMFKRSGDRPARPKRHSVNDIRDEDREHDSTAFHVEAPLYDSVDPESLA
jgi:hypothetical protein